MPDHAAGYSVVLIEFTAFNGSSVSSGDEGMKGFSVVVIINMRCMRVCVCFSYGDAMSIIS